MDIIKSLNVSDLYQVRIKCGLSRSFSNPIDIRNLSTFSEDFFLKLMGKIYGMYVTFSYMYFKTHKVVAGTKD